MRFTFSTEAVEGTLYVNPTDKVLMDEAANAALLIICAFSRRISLSQTNEAIQRMLKAESVGPLLHPTLWAAKDAFKRHAAGIEVVRRFEDLRRAIIEFDEIMGVDPYALQSTEER